MFDGLSFDGFPPFEYGRCSSEVDIGRRQVVQTLVVAAVSLLLVRATMSQDSSLTQSVHSVRQALTAYNRIDDLRAWLMSQRALQSIQD